MGSRWMREIVYEATNGNEWWRKAYSLWMRYVMDFTFQSENCGADRSYVSTEKNGTGGSFSGTSYVFTDVAGTFAFSDVGKFLIVKDNTNPRNAGIYKINQFMGTTQISIDFRAGYQEYPLASSGLSWWICGPTYQIPAIGEYVRLQSRHSTGWALEWAQGDWAYYAQCIRVAVTGDWAGKIIGMFSGSITGDSRYYNGLATAYGRQVFFAEGDYDGEWLHLWELYVDGGWTDSSSLHLLSVERFTPIEAGHSSDELLVLRGGESMAPDYFDAGDRTYNGQYARGRSWSDKLAAEITGYCFDHSLAGYGDAFARWPNREPNWRRDGKMEVFYGTPYITDENNSNGMYQILGYLGGHWTMPLMPSAQEANLDHLVSNRCIHRMVPMNMDGYGDKLLLVDGIIIPWCNWAIRG
jgi:hypothetical protein